MKRPNCALVVLVNVVLILGLAACSASEDSGSDAEFQEGGTFVVARTADIDKLDPHVATAFGTFQTLGLVYETLTDTDDQLEVVPSLAEEFEYSEDGRTLTFTLREGVTFHDGSELDSADVVASINRILDEKTGAVARTNFLSIKKVTASDPLTVTLQLSQPDATLPAALATVNAAIAPEEAIESGDIAKKPVGTGPFEFGEWKQGESVTLEAGSDYWAEGPFVDQVDFRVVPEESSILSGMQADQFQLGLLTDPQVATQVTEGSGLTLQKEPALAYHALMLNGQRSPLDKLQVRQAIACAIDRQEIIDSAALGEGEVTGPITSPSYESDPEAGLPCEPPDPETAKQLLDEAGFGDGFSLETIVMTGGYSTAVDESQSLKAQLAEIGVELQTTNLEVSVYVERWLAADFDAAVALNGGVSDPYLMYGRYFTSDGSLKGPAGLSSPELNRLLEEGREETDEPQRQEIFERFSQELLELSPWAWIFNGYEYGLVSSRVEGYKADPGGSLDSIATVRLRK
jgi:peptide/nickel transport system substrate-binding protein